MNSPLRPPSFSPPSPPAAGGGRVSALQRRRLQADCGGLRVCGSREDIPGARRDQRPHRAGQDAAGVLRPQPRRQRRAPAATPAPRRLPACLRARPERSASRTRAQGEPGGVVPHILRRGGHRACPRQRRAALRGVYPAVWTVRGLPAAPRRIRGAAAMLSPSAPLPPAPAATACRPALWRRFSNPPARFVRHRPHRPAPPQLASRSAVATPHTQRAGSPGSPAQMEKRLRQVLAQNFAGSASAHWKEDADAARSGAEEVHPYVSFTCNVE